MPVRQGHNQAMASAGADENTPKGGEPGPGPVTDETGLEPVQLIAMSDAASRMGALTLGSGTGSFRVLQAIARDLPEGSSVAELDAMLDEVEHRAALYGTRRLVLAAAVACAAFAFLNNGGWAECLVVFAASACGRFAQLVLARRKINQLACVLVAAAISCLVYVTVTTGIRHLDPGAAGLHASAFTSSVGDRAGGA